MPRSPIGKVLTPALLAVLAACATTPADGGGEESAAPQAGNEALDKHDRHQAMLSGPSSVGVKLMEFDKNLKIWSNLTLTAGKGEDKSRAQIIEDELRYKARRYFELVLEQLETGATNNRRIAAMAIGFSGYDRALSPLLAALHDPEVDVVSNAVLGLAVLTSRETPTDQLLLLLEAGITLELRVNCAWTLRRLFESGVKFDDDVLAGARRALADPEPGVRSQCCLLLASMVDTESIGRLSLLLEDEVPLVAVASGRSLAYIGARSLPHKGVCARALVAGMSVAENRAVREGILTSLMLISRLNYGKDVDRWQIWAAKLP